MSWNSRNLYPEYIEYLTNSNEKNGSVNNTCLSIHDLYYDIGIEPIMLAFYFMNYVLDSLNITYFLSEGIVLAVLRQVAIQEYEKDIDIKVLFDEKILNLINKRFIQDSDYKLNDLQNKYKIRFIMKKFGKILNDEFTKLISKCLLNERYFVGKFSSYNDYMSDFDIVDFLTVTYNGDWDYNKTQTGWLGLNYRKEYVSGYGEFWGFSIYNDINDNNKSKIYIFDDVRGNYNHGQDLSLYLPIQWILWKPYNWIVPLSNNPYKQSESEYGKNYMIPNIKYDQICQKQIIWLKKRFCSNSWLKKQKNEACYKLQNIIGNSFII